MNISMCVAPGDSLGVGLLGQRTPKGPPLEALGFCSLSLPPKTEEVVQRKVSQLDPKAEMQLLKDCSAGRHWLRSLYSGWTHDVK